MQEHLKFNILNFKWPDNLLTFYVSLKQTPESQTIHHSKFPANITDVFTNEELEEIEEVYTTFVTPTEGFKPLKVNFNNYNKNLYKQFLNAQIKKHFDSLNIINCKNGILKDRQVWVIDANAYNKDYHYYDKFTLKVQFAEVSDYPELVVSFDGTAQILKKSLRELENAHLVTRVIFRNQVFGYPVKTDTPGQEKFYNSLIFTEVFPLLNNDLQRELNIPYERKKVKNRYDKYLNKINTFTTEQLFTVSFQKVMRFREQRFIDTPLNRVGHIVKEKGMLEYGKDANGNKQLGITPKLELNRYRPYQRPKNPNTQFFFIYHKDHQPIIKKLWGYLKNGTGQGTYYHGLEAFIDIKLDSAIDNFIEFSNKENPIPEIEQKLDDLEWDKSIAYLGFYISPYTRFETNPQLKNIYYQVKELCLNEDILTQAIDFEDLQRNIGNYQWHLNNISLAIHAKLGGKPWKLATTDKKELVIGVGAFTNQDQKHRYVASAFSFQNNGIFNNFECFSKSQTSQLAGSIIKAIRTFFNQSEADKIVIHFYKEMSKTEMQPILDGMHLLNLKNKPIYILNINKTESKDIIAFDEASQGDWMPYSGTFIRIGERKFLLFNNGRFENEKFYATDGYPFPIKVSMSSPSTDAFDDDNVITELLTQVFQFSRLYWKSLKPQNVPITIKYPELVAKIVPRFKSDIKDEAKNKLWFL